MQFAVIKAALSATLALALLCVPAIAWRYGSAVIPANNGGMLMNPNAPYYAQPYNLFLNWWNTASYATLVSGTYGSLDGKAIWDKGVYFDPNTGDLKNPVPADVVYYRRTFFAPVTSSFQLPFANYANEVWDVTWKGCASPTVSLSPNGSGTGGGISSSANAAVITFGSSSLSTTGLQFTMTASCYNDPPRQIKICQRRYKSYCDAGKIFNPDWIANIKQFGVIRLMDVMHTINSGITDSSQLAGTEYSYWADVPFTTGINANISGTTMNVTYVTNGLNMLSVGSKVYQHDVTSGTVITGTSTVNSGLCSPACTGAGGTGTYAVNNSQTASFTSGFVVPVVGDNGASGPKGGIGPDIVCELYRQTGAWIEYAIPVAATDQFVTDVATAFLSCGAKIKYSYGNENWNPNSFPYLYMAAQSPISGNNYSGYRSAQIFEKVYNVYGAGNRSKWWGALGSQTVSTGVTTQNISGARSWLTGGSAFSNLWDLVDTIEVAPYYSNYIGGKTVTGATQNGTATTVTAASHGFTNGQVVKIFVSGGTMSSVLNNVYATVSNAATSTFDINIDTTGLTYASAPSGTNYVMDAALFKLADQSAALNISTPATYPTKFSYFAQQMSKAILTGSASDASYGTITQTNNYNLSSAANAIPDLIKQHQVIAVSNGIALSEYEGGFTNGMIYPINGANADAQLYEYSQMWVYDSGVVGDAVNTPANTQATAFQALRDASSAYSAQYTDSGLISKAGPWPALRSIGDQSNPRWQSIVTENALGPYVDPTPPATWSVSWNISNANFSTLSSSEITCTFDAPSDGLAIVVTGQSNTNTPTAIQLDGGADITTPDAINTNSVWRPSIWSVPVTAGSGHTIKVKWGNGATTYRNCAVIVASGLSSNTPLSVSNSAQHDVTVNVTKGSLIVGASTLPGVTTNTYQTTSTTSGRISGCPSACSNVFSYNNVGGAFAFAYWSPGPTFSTTSFHVVNNNSNGDIAVTYR